MSLLRIAGTMLIFAASINGQIVTPFPSVAFPVYESGNTTITDDTKGLYFSPITDDIQLGDVARFYTEVVPIQECTLTVTSPVIPHWTAQFLTHTSTSFEAGDITTSSVAPDVSPPPPPGPPASPSPTPSTPVPNPPSPVPNLPSLSSSPGPVPEPNPQAPLPPSSSISKVQPLVEQTASQQALPDGSITPENPSQLPQSDQSTASATYVSGTSTPNDELPGISPLQTTSGSSSEAVITFTGVTDDVSFTNIYTSIIPVPTQLTTSDGRLVSPVYRVMGPLAVTIGLLLCI
ncbi:hypothetical protein IFR05_005357 [Cadophora sp. M221]|nr:hypothetical protein IFR05_005357 [Cadophora sp. M221]